MIVIVSALMLSMTGCFVSHTTKEKEVPTTSGVGRRCGNEICAADERCVQSDNGYFHCE
jgi:hypothetical protein